MHEPRHEEELILFHYKELFTDREKEFLIHLDACAECRQRLETMKQASACAIESAMEPPQSVVDAIRRKAKKAAEVKKTRTNLFALRPRWAFAGALASVMAVSLYFVSLKGGPDQVAWKDSIDEEIESLDNDVSEFRMSLSDTYAWSSFDLEYTGIESENMSVENSIKWREL